MKEDEKEKNKNNKIIEVDENDNEDFLQIDNLNINQEVDIKENPKKYIVNTKKNMLKNAFDNNLIDITENVSTKKNKKNSVKRSITYEDIYLGNEMFITPQKSFPRDYEKNNKYLINFTKIYEKSYSSNSHTSSISNNSNISNISNISNNSNYNSGSSTNNNSNYSISEEDDYEDYNTNTVLLRNNSYDSFDKKGESSHLKDFLASINNYRQKTFENIINEDEEDKIFIDEDEKIGENVIYIEKEKELNNLNYYNKKNKCNISYITVNMFIKKICTENLKNKYPILYKSFINQYQEFLSIPSLIEKIIQAFDYYTKKINIEVPDLLDLLNKILSTQYKKIEKNENLKSKLKSVYKEMKSLTWIDIASQKVVDNINHILTSNNNDEFDFQYTKHLVSDRRKSKGISIKTRTKAKVVNNIALYKYPYFYIFDYSDEEIARNLTLISYKMMSAIDINELWNNNFSKKEKYTKAPNVMKLIDRFDKLIRFIIEDICSYETNKTRAKLITKWANIAKRCKDLHNYNDLLIINQGFNQYLKKMVSAWKKLPKSTLVLISDLNKFCNNQQCYINIRREIVGCKHKAYIPYLGILLQEIVDIENKYKYLEKFSEYNCINCVKLQKIYYAVNKFFEFKNFSFTFTQIYDLNILNQLNPKTSEEIEYMISDNEKNKSTFKELIKTGNKKKPTKSDEKYYC